MIGYMIGFWSQKLPWRVLRFFGKHAKVVLGGDRFVQQPPENFCFTASICFFSAFVEGYQPFFAMQL